MNDDLQLIRDYAASQSELAFETLVERHINLVHSAAMRQVRDPHLAEEVTQAVFIILARKAGTFRSDVILASWLHRTACFAARDAMKSRIRRACREQEAYMQSASNESQSALEETWTQISPLLDTAIADLSEKDRAAIVLRYFEDRNLSDVGKALGTSEDSARMRVNRALEKLRKFFNRRGVISTTAVIAGVISANSVQAAPAMLANSVTAIATAKGVAASGSILTLVKGVLKMMMWNKIKLAALFGVTVLATGAAGVVAQQATGKAKIPYKVLDDATQFIAGVNQSNLVLRMTFGSKHVLQPTNIHLAIESRTRGSIPVQLDSNGQLLNFPHDDALRRENPFVVSDLPKGSLDMTIMTRLPKPTEPAFRYSRLGDGVVEINKAVTRANQMIKQDYAKEMLPFKKQVQGVIFTFPPGVGAKGTVTIASVKGKREYTSNARGNIKLRIEKALLDENPEVQVSPTSYFIIPDLE